jgi:hypothetical protein
LKNRLTAETANEDMLETIKQLAIVAMFSDDELMEQLVLKGGNAMDIVHQLHSRASIDLDFSLADDLDFETLQPKLARSLETAFRDQALLPFDVKASIRPREMPDALAEFWGGYLIEFKLISRKRADEVARNIDTMRREAIKLGEGPKFTIDISPHEYIESKQEHELLGYRIYVYSPEMIVCEKLRALCQQMPEYGPIIQRSGAGKQRARDFVDIEVLVQHFDVDLASERAQITVREMFAAKRVPLALLANIRQAGDFHALGFPSVHATMRPGVALQEFGYYVDFVANQCTKLEALWNV